MIIIFASFDYISNVSKWSNGEEARLIKQSMYVRILSLEKNLLRVHVCLWRVLHFLVILILSCMNTQGVSAKTLVCPRIEKY